MKKSIQLFVILLTFCAVNSYAQNTTLKVINYNVLEGFKQDTSKMNDFVEWVSKQNPDILIMQEVNKFSQKSLESLAVRYGHHYAVLAKPTGYPVAITSKYPIINVQKVIDNMYHGYIYAQIKNYHVFAVHFAPREAAKRKLETEQILDHVASLPVNANIIISGDFNAYSESDQDNYEYQIKKGLNLKRLQTYKEDFAMMKLYESKGLVDVYKKLNPTGYKRSFPTVLKDNGDTGSRIDYILMSRTLADKAVKAEIVHDKVTNTVSDHYPVVVEIKK
jgi:exodeoxyribonuclease-3